MPSPNRPLRSLRLLALASPALLAGRLAAQAPSLPHVIPAPAIMNTTAAVVSGDLDGNRTPEIAYIQNGTLVVCHDPALTDDAIIVATDVFDVCYSPVAAGSEKPGLIYSTAAGIYTARFKIVSGSNPVASYDTQLIHGSTSVSLNAVRLRYAEDQGVPRIFFMEGLGEEFFRLTWGGTSWGSEEHLGGITPAVLDFQMIAYCGDDALEFAILHANGIEVRDQVSWDQGQACLASSGSVAGDAIAPVTVDGLGECLAWVTRSGSASTLFLFCDSLSPEYLQVDIPAGNQYRSMVSADCDGDGLEDLVLGRTTSAVDVLRQTTSTSVSDHFLGAEETSLSPDLSLLHPMGNVVCEDLFNDRDVDGDTLPAFAAPIPQAGGLALVRQALPAGTTAPDFQLVSYVCVLGVETWRIELGGGWGSTTANAVELHVRRHRLGQDRVDNVKFHNMRRYLPDEGAVGGFEIEFDTLCAYSGCVGSSAGDRFYAEVRPVTVNGSGSENEAVASSTSTTASWRWSILGMASTCCSLEALKLSNYAFTPFVDVSGIGCYESDPFQDCEGCTSHGVGTQIVPVAVPQTRVPHTGNLLPIVLQPNY